jgi:hypothetical protein
MIGHQGPCKTASPTVGQNRSQPPNKISVINSNPKNVLPFDPPYDDVMQRPGRIQSGFAWHESSITGNMESVKQ